MYKIVLEGGVDKRAEILIRCTILDKLISVLLAQVPYV